MDNIASIFSPFLSAHLLVALLIGVTAAPLGCLIVWRRMAYFGDALSHTALLGVALGLVFGVNVYLGGALVCGFFAGMLVWLQRQRSLSMDTVLGILAHGGLSLGILALALLPHENNETSQGENQETGHNTLHEMESYLFGDLTHIQLQDIIFIVPACLIVLIILRRYWQRFILMTLSEDLARAEGVNTTHLHILLMFMLTLIVALAMKSTGVLFITSLLIIPAAAARQLSTSQRQMTLWAMLISLIGVTIGVSLTSDTHIPSGPATIGVLSALFVLSLVLGIFIRRKRPRL